MSMFSLSSRSKNRTTNRAFSLVSVMPLSASVVIAFAWKTMLRGCTVVCHSPSRLNASSTFSTKLSMLRSRFVMMMGVLHIVTG